VSQRPILLIGAGGHARACIDVIEQQGEYRIAGLVGLQAEVGTKVLGYEVVGDDAQLDRVLTRNAAILIAVGQIKTPEIRKKLYAQAQQAGCIFPRIVSPRAYVSRHARVGEGTIVMHGAVINAAASVGRNCIINSLALVEHDAVIGDHCHIATNAAVNSGTQVGSGTFIGSGTSLRQGLMIGESCVIGMGQRIIANCADAARIPAGRPA
jgi:sugar O-acyltransferase (sialic acid O-acetyltransferase NeuD family)